MKLRGLRPTCRRPALLNRAIVVFAQEFPRAHGIGSGAGVPCVALHSGSLRAVGHSSRPAGLLVRREFPVSLCRCQAAAVE